MDRIHAACAVTAEAPNGTPLQCTRPKCHADSIHRDAAQGYIWTDVTVPEREV